MLMPRSMMAMRAPSFKIGVPFGPISLHRCYDFDVSNRERAPSEHVTRCTWSANDPLMTAYHDQEWGVPVHDDRALFEFPVLEGAQAGLSWSTILKKRPAYRTAFDDFDPRKVARYNEAKIAALLAN